MKWNFYETFYLNLRISTRYGKINARAAGDAGELEFYTKLEKFINDLKKETEEYIEDQRNKEQ